mgnify:CR=1 FL=1
MVKKCISTAFKQNKRNDDEKKGLLLRISELSLKGNGELLEGTPYHPKSMHFSQTTQCYSLRFSSMQTFKKDEKSCKIHLKFWNFHTCHNCLWNGINLVIHDKFFVRCELHNNDTEIGPSQIQRKELSTFVSVGKCSNECGKTFDTGIFTFNRTQAFLKRKVAPKSQDFIFPTKEFLKLT